MHYRPLLPRLFFQSKLSLGLMLTFVLLVSGDLRGQQRITAARAKDHLGENVTVCGRAISVKFAQDTRGTPTFLNLDKAYPEHIFTVVVWGNDRPKFPNVEQYQGKEVCISGIVATFRDKPEIIARDPEQLRLDKGPNPSPSPTPAGFADPKSHFVFFKNYEEQTVQNKNDEYASELRDLNDCKKKYTDARAVYNTWVEVVASNIEKGNRPRTTSDYKEFPQKAQESVDSFNNCPESQTSRVSMPPNKIMTFTQTQPRTAPTPSGKQSWILPLVNEIKQEIVGIFNRSREQRKAAAEEIRQKGTWRTWDEIVKVASQQPANKKN